MLGAARIGEREILALGREFGWAALDAFVAEYFDYSEDRMAAAIGRLPAGSIRRTSVHDPFPGTPPEGVSVTAKVDVRPSQGRISIDLTENLDCLPCGLNLSEACARTAALVGVFNSLDHLTPRNAGSFRRVDISLRENCIVGIPRHPASCSLATSNLSDRVANAVQAAIAELADGVGLAEAGAVIPASMAVVSGRQADGRAFVNQILLGFSGGPASPQADGWQTLMHVGAAGMCLMDSVELDELRQPLVVYERRFALDSEGAGRTRGASGLRVEYGPTADAIEIAYASDGSLNPAKGVRGGGDGAPASQSRIHCEGEQALPPCGQFRIASGERVRATSAGGGGYGPPAARPAAAVAADVAEGWISCERAERVYRVRLDAEGRIDERATGELRRSLA
jgi:N-methylhydantoinase B